MKQFWIGLAAAAAFFAVTGVSAAGAAGDAAALKVKNKDWKGIEVLLKNGRLYSTPEALEKGGLWDVTKEGDAYFVAVPVNEKKEMTSVRLPVGDDGLADLTFFSEQAGLKYKLDEKKKEIKFDKNKKAGKKAKAGEPDGPVLILWDPDENFDPAQPFFTEKAGARVVSPSWGTYEKISAGKRYYPISYVEKAQKAGIAVMPLVDNDFDPDQTSALMKDPARKEALIRHLLAYASVYGLEGWNIDFENMDPRDKMLFSDFMTDLSRRMHKMGKKVSVDITVIGDESSYWNGSYDRKSLSKEADYLVLMGYDQTAGGSSHAGPVSSYNWLDASLPALLKEIPAEKLILGLPFYTRVWTGEDGQTSSDVLTLQYVDEFTRRHKIMPVWKKDERQFYSDWVEGGVRKRVWLEEARSLGEKLGLLRKYDLAGAAFWRYGFEPASLYESLEAALGKKGK